MKVSAREEYGLRAAAALAAQYGNGPVSLGDVAQSLHMSLDYLEQVIPLLRQAGLVSSKRGARGGYELARPPAEITVGDVLRALEGDLLPVQCVRHDPDHSCDQQDRCAARVVWELVHRRVRDALDGISLADLA